MFTLVKSSESHPFTTETDIVYDRTFRRSSLLSTLDHLFMGLREWGICSRFLEGLKGPTNPGFMGFVTGRVITWGLTKEEKW